ncbi:MAG: hypothetical protein HC822_21235, partial [Oscillochloris sp.]|nr:hypothetical protein [Oscillochloris sp.]
SNSSTASFTFSGNDGSGAGIASFECALDGAAFATCTSPQAYTGLSDGDHSFQVRAIDHAGNSDATPASFTWTVDTTGPNTTIDTQPSDPSNSSTASFTFSGNDGSGSGIESFACALDGAAFATCTSPQAYTGLSDGSHSFQVRAIDHAGNSDATPASFTWTVDTTGPNTTIDSQPSNPSNSSTASFTFSGNDGSGAGIASFECALDGAAFATCTSPQAYTDLSDGDHTFQVRAIDHAGNSDATPASFTWTVDATVPSAIIAPIQPRSAQHSGG